MNNDNTWRFVSLQFWFDNFDCIRRWLDGVFNMWIYEREQLIRANGGAVTAEQLAPLLTPREPKEEDSRMIVDESFVLPILTALDGLPEVSVCMCRAQCLVIFQCSYIVLRCVPYSNVCQTLYTASYSACVVLCLSAKHADGLFFHDNTITNSN